MACLDVVPDNLDETVEALAILGGKAVAYRCDVTDEAEVNETVAEVASALGRPEVLCNVAGIGTFAHTAEMPLAQWERILAVNLTGHVPHDQGGARLHARAPGREHRQHRLDGGPHGIGLLAPRTARRRVA